MRLPIASPLVSRDGAANKDARLTNMLKEMDGSRELAVTRPGLTLVAEGAGAGGGLVAFNGELISVYGTTLGTVDGSVQLNDWTFTNPFASSFSILDISYFKGQYLVTGTTSSEGTDIIYASSDAVSWRIVYSLSIVSGGESFNNTIFTFASSDDMIIGLYFSGPIGGPYEMKSVVSTDGITWNTHSIGSYSASVLSILWDGTYFIASFENGLIKSTDGINWITAGALPTGAVSGFDRGSWAVLDNKILAVFQDNGSGDLWFWVSDDHAATWTHCTQFAESSPITSGNGKFVTIRENIAPNFDIYDSTDGLTWTYRATITAVGLSISSTISFSNGLFLVWTGGSLLAGDTGVYATSEDAQDWTTYPQVVFGSFWTVDREIATKRGFLMYGADASIGVADVLETIVPLDTVAAGIYDFAQGPL